MKEFIRRTVLSRQDGIAMLTVMLLLLMLTVIGIGAMTVTGLENRMAGFVQTGEASAQLADTCLGTAVNVIQQTIAIHELPLVLRGDQVPPGPVPQGQFDLTNREIMGFPLLTNAPSENNPDTATSAPNISQTINTYQVNGDIDRLYLEHTPGCDSSFGNSCTKYIYRVTCVATQGATGASSQVTATYACTTMSSSLGGCIKKI